MPNSRLVLLAGVIALGMVSGGCSKKNEDPSANSAVEPANQAVPTSPAGSAPLARASESPVEREANSRLEDLQLQVDAYEKIYKRKPASLDQMIREGFMQRMPPAPPGKRFVYDAASGRVSLVP